MSSPAAAQRSPRETENVEKGAPLWSHCQGSGQPRTWGGPGKRPARSRPLGVLPFPVGDSDPSDTCLLCLPSRGRVCHHPRSQGTKAELRAGSAPVTNERLARHCSPNPALMRGCSPEAGAGGVGETSGAGSSSGCFRDCLDQNLSCLWISLLPLPPDPLFCHQLPETNYASPSERLRLGASWASTSAGPLRGGWGWGTVMRGESEKSGHDSNRWCVAQEGPGWSWNS